MTIGAKRILFANPFGIGDVLFSLAAVEAARKSLPRVEIGLLCNERVKELITLYPGVTTVHELDRDRFRKIRTSNPVLFLREYRRLIRSIAEKKYDVMVDYSLGREFSFLGFCAGIHRRIGFDYRGRGFFLNEKTPFEGYEKKSVAESQLEILQSLGIRPPAAGTGPLLSISPELEKRASLFFQHEALEDAGSFMAMAPGGGKSWGVNAIYKQWNPEKFAEAANTWCVESKAAVLLIGDESERELLEIVRRNLAVPNKMVCGQSLGVVAALLKRVQFLLGNDGGLIHMAHALGVKTVPIFGPVDEKVYGPYGAYADVEVVCEPVACRPCYSRFHFPPCPHERRCLEQLSVQKVLAAIAKIS